VWLRRATRAVPRGLPVGTRISKSSCSCSPSTKLRRLQSLTAFGRRARYLLSNVRAAPLVRSWAPSALSNGASPRSSRACLTRFVPSSGFLTLLTAFSSPVFRALFHARALLEFHPYRAFATIPEPRNLSTPLLPSCPSPPYGARPTAVPSSLQIPRDWPPARPTCPAGLQGVVPRVVFGPVFVRLPSQVGPWLSWVSAPLQGSPSWLAQRVLPPPLLPRAWYHPMPSFRRHEAVRNEVEITGSTKSSRGHDRSRFRET